MDSFSRSEIICFSFGLNFRDFLHAHLVLVLLLRSFLCFEVLTAFIRFHYRLLYIYHFPCLTVKGRSPPVPYFYTILSYLSESGGKKIEDCILAPMGSLRDGGRSRGEDSHGNGRPRSNPPIASAQRGWRAHTSSLCRMEAPQQRQMTTHARQRQMRRVPPTMAPTSPWVIPLDTVSTPITKNASMPANLGFGRGCCSS